MTKLRKGNHRSEEQKEILVFINRPFNAREDVIQLFDDYAIIASEARYK